MSVSSSGVVFYSADLLRVVFSCLNMTERQKALVSREARSAQSLTPFSDKALTVRNSSIGDADLFNRLRRFSSLESLEICRSLKVSLKLLGYLTNLRSLRILRIQACPEATDLSLINLVKNLPHLERITVAACPNIKMMHALKRDFPHIKMHETPETGDTMDPYAITEV